jgi:hypothetical protein
MKFKRDKVRVGKIGRRSKVELFKVRFGFHDVSKADEKHIKELLNQYRVWYLPDKDEWGYEVIVMEKQDYRKFCNSVHKGMGLSWQVMSESEDNGVTWKDIEYDIEKEN